MTMVVVVSSVDSNEPSDQDQSFMVRRLDTGQDGVGGPSSSSHFKSAMMGDGYPVQNLNHPKSMLMKFNQIHSHCENCVRPSRCIRIPVAVQRTSELSMEEKYSMILDVNYHHSSDDSCPSSSSSMAAERPEIILPQDDRCPVIRCTNDGCQMLMHYCKLKEHFLLCQYQTVPCINHHYGCPQTMLRHQIASHLDRHCPANVVHCSAEWNRWPMHTSEKSSQTQVFCSPHSLNIHHLDVALALRDQRMLKQLWSASRQMKRIMRGCLSTHPAVPIKPYIGIRTFREFRCQNNNQQPPQQQPVENGGPLQTQISTNTCENIDEEKYINYASKLVEEAYKESLVEILRQTANYYRRIYYEKSYDDSQEKARKKSNSICVHSAAAGNSMNLLLPLSPGQSFPSSSSINLPILTDEEKSFLSEMIAKKAKEQREEMKKVESADSIRLKKKLMGSMPPAPPPVPKCNTLSLEISIRSYAFYQPKPRAMYTFRCGMDFRKDELAAHSKDIHSDIHGGLDGWIEHRCPLFQYGCTFVHRRMSPVVMDSNTQPRWVVVYNEALETFACCSAGPEDSLTHESPGTLPTSPSLESESDDDELRNNIRVPGKIKNRNAEMSSSLSPSSYSLMSNSSVPLLMSTSTSSEAILSPVKIVSAMLGTVSSSASSSASPFNSPLMAVPPTLSTVAGKANELNHLPFEILQIICKFLDGFSLNNLSFTSKRMRNMVQSFVKKRGYVVLQWKRFELEKGKYHWKIVYKKWLFSTAMQPIKDWRMDADNVMAGHLSQCPFNDRVVHHEPFRLADIRFPLEEGECLPKQRLSQQPRLFRRGRQFPTSRIQP